MLCEAHTEEDWRAQPIVVESATSDQYVLENLINEVNVDARPMAGMYDVADNKEVRLYMCNLSPHPLHI